MINILRSISLLLLLLSLASCGNDFNVDEYYDLEELPGYVAFDAPGNTVVLNPITVNENGGPVSLVVECPTGTQSDITVSYSLSGNAIFGTDYMINGAQASGGNVIIKPNANDIQNPDRGAISVTLLTDGVIDGQKTITITLIDASNATGTLAVGRGGTDYLKTATIVINDVDM
jgi:hypothetical protein